jgi:hypothetical protein
MRSMLGAKSRLLRLAGIFAAIAVGKAGKAVQPSQGGGDPCSASSNHFARRSQHEGLSTVDEPSGRRGLPIESTATYH